MHSIAYTARLAAFGLVVVVGACGRSSTVPNQPSPTPGQVAGQTTFTIVNGWSREPVPGAAVTANGREVATDASGHVQFPATSGCLTIEVTAAGFLDRRTCGSASASQITLWPVANADESGVTRKWLFNNDRISGEYMAVPMQIAIEPELAARAGMPETWRAAADAITQVSQGRIRFEWVTSAPQEGVVIVEPDTPLSCSVVPPWPFEIGGFCITYDPNVYALDRLQVSPDRLTDGSLALRALLSEAGIKTQSLPGLMNMTRPDPDFSEYERRTLGMLGLRPRTVLWPDYDQIP